MVLKLYYDIMSQPSRSVLIFLKANKIEFEGIVISLRNGDHLTDEFQAITPFKKVPVIDHDGFILTESGAILKYLSISFNSPNIKYPISNPRLLARMDEYMFWHGNALRACSAAYFLGVVLSPLLNGEPIDAYKLKRLNNNLRKSIELIQNVFLKNQRYLAGDSLTICDLLAVEELEQVVMAGYNMGNHPKITKYMESIQIELSPWYDEVHQKATLAKDNLVKQFSKI